MDRNRIISLLKEYPTEHTEAYASYLYALSTEKKDKLSNELKNPWINFKSEKDLADAFMKVAKDGLVFDGKHITWQSTGVSYDYVAYKNKMLIAYPESKIDLSLVYKGDTFSVAKESGSVMYSHSIADPFNQEEKDIIGGYCIIINKRGDFLTLLGNKDIEKHRKVARTDFIWKAWFKEMCLKTVIKKACKQHFDDIYKNIEEIDNENYNLDNPIDLDLRYKSEIDAINTVEELREYYLANKGRGKDFDQYVTIRKEALSKTL